MKRFLFIASLILIVIVSGSTSAKTHHPELIIVIMNHVGWNDLKAADAPHLQLLIQEGAVGLLNVKNYSGFLSSSAFMTMGMSNRTRLDDKSTGAFNRDEKIPYLVDIQGGQFFRQLTGESARGALVFPEISRYQRVTRDLDFSARPGALGQLLVDHNIRVAMYGNADVLGEAHREAGFLLMDTSGQIAEGDVGQSMLRQNPKAPFGVSTDGDAIIRRIRENSQPSQVILIETGDTSRLEYKNALFDPVVLRKRRIEAIEELDPLLGQLVDLSPRYLILLGANANSEMIKTGNTGLVPILLYGNGRGLLRSESTRRKGYVTNLDILPTIASLLRLELKAPSKGFPMEILPDVKGVGFLQEQEEFYRNLRNVRYKITDTMVVFYLLTLILGLIGLWQGYHYQRLRWLYGLILSMFLLPLGLTLGGIWGYSPLWPSLLTAGAFCGSLGFVLIRMFPLRRAIAIVTIAVPILFLWDVFMGGGWMMRSPMGSDVIAGGRFYGIGNDLMGVVMGSLITGIGLLGNASEQLRRTARWWAPPLLLLATLGVGLPFFGANVGGMITALMAGVVATLVLFEVKISVRKLVWMLAGVLAVVVVVASIDAFFNARPTHAGRAILSLLDQGKAGFGRIIGVKLRILSSTIRNSAWTWLFAVESLALLFVRWICPEFHRQVAMEAPFWRKMMLPLGTSCIFALAVNDTGIIPAAIILSYYWFSGLALYFEASLDKGFYHRESPAIGIQKNLSPS